MELKVDYSDNIWLGFIWWGEMGKEKCVPLSMVMKNHCASGECFPDNCP